MSRFFSTLLALFAFALAFVAAAPTGVTNGERLKLGLGPLKPKNLFSPTRANKPRSSPAPAIRAVIKAFDITDTTSPSFLGYVAPSGSGEFGVTSDPKAATVVTPQLSSLQPGNLPFETPTYGYAELGFAANPGSETFGAKVVGGATLAATDATSVNSVPLSSDHQSMTAGGATFMESAVWYLVDNISLEIRPYWINPDTTQAPTQLAYMPYFDAFFIAGDYPTTAAAFLNMGVGTSPVRFYLDIADA